MRTGQQKVDSIVGYINLTLYGKPRRQYCQHAFDSFWANSKKVKECSKCKAIKRPDGKIILRHNST